MIKYILGDVREELIKIPDNSVDCIVTSPPYFGLRNYDNNKQIGQEADVYGYLYELQIVCFQLRRVLKPTGTFWLNIGDSYINKKLAMIPNRIALNLTLNNDWIARSEIIWHKKSVQPESVKDRPTQAHEKIWFFTKTLKYYYDADAIRNEPTDSMLQHLRHGYNGTSKKFNNISMAQDGSATKKRIINNARKKINFEGDWTNLQKSDIVNVGSNCRNVWLIDTPNFKDAHFATFPEEIPERCIKAGCPVGGTVLDPFGGAGTTAMVANRLGRDAIMIELNPEFMDLAKRRIAENQEKLNIIEEKEKSVGSLMEFLE